MGGWSMRERGEREREIIQWSQVPSLTQKPSNRGLKADDNRNHHHHLLESCRITAADRQPCRIKGIYKCCRHKQTIKVGCLLWARLHQLRNYRGELSWTLIFCRRCWMSLVQDPIWIEEGVVNSPRNIEVELACHLVAKSKCDSTRVFKWQTSQFLGMPWMFVSEKDGCGLWEKKKKHWTGLE